MRLGSKRPKYGNRRTIANGLVFDSKREAERYGQLVLLQRNGEVRALDRQVEYRLEANGALICRYRADFVYEELVRRDRALVWERVVEDVKGVKTAVYRLKKRLMKILHGIEIRES